MDATNIIPEIDRQLRDRNVPPDRRPLARRIALLAALSRILGISVPELLELIATPIGPEARQN